MILIYGWRWAERAGVPEVTESLKSVLDGLGYNHTEWEDEVPFAEMLGDMGYTREMVSAAERTADAVSRVVDDKGIKVAVTPFAHIYHVWNRVLPESGVEFPVPMEHVTTFLRDNLGNAKLQPVRGRYILHDACRLGRIGGLGDAPRDVLARIPELEIVEFEHPEMAVRDLKPWDISPCPGGWLSLAISELMPHVASGVLKREVLPRGVDGIITTCALSYLAFREGCRAAGADMDVKFFTDVVAGALGR